MKCVWWSVIKFTLSLVSTTASFRLQSLGVIGAPLFMVILFTDSVVVLMHMAVFQFSLGWSAALHSVSTLQPVLLHKAPSVVEGHLHCLMTENSSPQGSQLTLWETGSTVYLDHFGPKLLGAVAGILKREKDISNEGHFTETYKRTYIILFHGLFRKTVLCSSKW